MENEQKQTLAPKYKPKQEEADRYSFWTEGKIVEVHHDSDKEHFSIVIPPLNVTGRLHLGHSWDTTMQDTISRMKRMQGYDLVWLPGMDHAGRATQAKVEEKLREDKISRYDLGR